MSLQSDMSKISQSTMNTLNKHKQSLNENNEEKDMKTNNMVQKALGCLALVMGLALLTSCDEDDKRSYKLSGDWYGDFGMYYYTNRGQRFDSYDTEIQFLRKSGINKAPNPSRSCTE